MFPTRCLPVALLLLAVAAADAQTLTPAAVVPAGASDVNGRLGWTLGQSSSVTFPSPENSITSGVQQPEGVELQLNIALLLQGPFDIATGLMHDSLRTRGLLPLQEPFTALGHPAVGLQQGARLEPEALLVSGPGALVDWVFLELRAADDPALIIAARAAVVQRDGDVVDMDGLSPVHISVLPGSYHLALRHRNHLPVMTLAPLALGTGVNTADLITGTPALHVADAQAQQGPHHLMRQGDVNGDGRVQYTGASNDRDPVLLAVGGVVPTQTINGYHSADVNMDGTVKYTGSLNDRDPILITIGGIVPTAVRSQPLP
ncbi:MAG TPA: hypothetical protein VGE21_01175 [Flavobacteriales bacterium]